MLSVRYVQSCLDRFIKNASGNALVRDLVAFRRVFGASNDNYHTNLQNKHNSNLQL